MSTEGGPGMAQRKYCKNTVPGRQGRGKKYPARVRAEVVMAMISSNSICAVARKYAFDNFSFISPIVYGPKFFSAK